MERVIPLNTVANPVIAVSGMNSSAETMATIKSLVTNFNTDLKTPTLSLIESDTTAVLPDPATVVGPISVHAEPL